MDKEIIEDLEILILKFKEEYYNNCTLIEKCSCGDRCCGCRLNQRVESETICDILTDLVGFFEGD